MDVPEVGRQRFYYNALRTWCTKQKDKRMGDAPAVLYNYLREYVSAIPSCRKWLYQQTLSQHTIELYVKMYLHKTTTLSQVPTRAKCTWRTLSGCACTPQYQGLTAKTYHTARLELKGKPYLRWKTIKKLVRKREYSTVATTINTKCKPRSSVRWKRRLTKFLCLKRQKRSMNQWTRCKSKCWWKTWRQRARVLPSAWAKVFEKEIRK